MRTIKEIYKIGHGPSSSHTMGPSFAAEIFLKNIPDIRKADITLYGSLAATGKGHLTDKALTDIFHHAGVEVSIVWQPKTFLPFHPNAMKFEAYDAEKNFIDSWTVYSVGGGSLKEEKPKFLENANPDIYPHTHMKDIMEYCIGKGLNYWEYVQRYEDADLWDYLAEV